MDFLWPVFSCIKTESRFSTHAENTAHRQPFVFHCFKVIDFFVENEIAAISMGGM